MRSYAWHGGFIPRDFPGAPFEAADSWRHSHGRANGLDLHLARFEAASGPLPTGFVDAMLPLIAAGELFPRIALSGGLLLLDVRPAPPPRPTTRLTYVRAADPRTRPEVKGPDFGALRAYRTRHQLEGTDDTVIVDAAGAMLETTTGALAAWDGETLTVPDGVRLPSVTLHQAARRAREAGARVQRRRFTPEFAAAHPLWFLNSLHGISPVTELRSPEAPGVALHPPAHPGAAEWQSWWWGGFA